MALFASLSSAGTAKFQGIYHTAGIDRTVLVEQGAQAPCSVSSLDRCGEWYEIALRFRLEVHE